MIIPFRFAIEKIKTTLSHCVSWLGAPVTKSRSHSGLNSRRGSLSVLGAGSPRSRCEPGWLLLPCSPGLVGGGLLPLLTRAFLGACLCRRPCLQSHQPYCSGPTPLTSLYLSLCEDPASSAVPFAGTGLRNIWGGAGGRDS